MEKRAFLFFICVALSFMAVHFLFDGGKPPRPLQKEASSEHKEASSEKSLFADRSLEQKKPLNTSWESEEFYALENSYQQLVFSNRGGALAEINLLLRGAKSEQSIVREIDIDREILAQSPENGRFPLHPYWAVSESGERVEREGVLGGYYPLLRRSIAGPDGSWKSQVSPEFYALNLLGENPSLLYRVTRFEKDLIQFEADTENGKKIVKTFSFPREKPGPYCLMLDLKIEGEARGLWLSSGIPDVEIVGGSYSPLLRYQVTRKMESEVDTISLPKKGALYQDISFKPNWISNNNGFFGLILDPLTEIPAGYQAVQIEGEKVPTRFSLIDAKYHLYPPADYPGYATHIPAQTGTFRIFAGPFDNELLKDLDELYDDPLTNYNPQYIQAQSIQGWFSFISQPFAKFLFFLMQIFYAVTRSWAAAIILLTIALRIMMYPLNAWSIRSTTKMQEISPKVQAVQEKYKNDPKKARMEVMALYKQAKIGPAGCLPFFLQMPFLFGMFYLLKSSFPLRGAPFIPGWIDDLAAPDILFGWGPPLWFIGNEFHLLPVLMGFSMYLQQRFSGSKTPKDPQQMSDAQKQQKTMGHIMSVFLTVMFYNFPSGLNIYFMFSTLLGVLQQWWMTKKPKLCG